MCGHACLLACVWKLTPCTPYSTTLKNLFNIFQFHKFIRKELGSSSDSKGLISQGDFCHVAVTVCILTAASTYSTCVHIASVYGVFCLCFYYIFYSQLVLMPRGYLSHPTFVYFKIVFFMFILPCVCASQSACHIFNSIWTPSACVCVCWLWWMYSKKFFLFFLFFLSRSMWLTIKF